MISKVKWLVLVANVEHRLRATTVFAAMTVMLAWIWRQGAVRMRGRMLGCRQGSVVVGRLHCAAAAYIGSQTDLQCRRLLAVRSAARMNCE